MKGKVVTLDETERWYICEETVQNGNKYYLGLELAGNEPTEDSKSCIFKEEKEGNNIYLVEETDPEIFKYITSVFIKRLMEAVDNLD